jgi:aminoglycoside phosphotransferase (APT) family kinase protein
VTDQQVVDLVHESEVLGAAGVDLGVPAAKLALGVAGAAHHVPEAGRGRIEGMERDEDADGLLPRRRPRLRRQGEARVGVGQHPAVDEAHDVELGARHAPGQGTGVVHGDFRPGNLAFGPDGTVRAVFDWELATTGDPLADLGWLAATWEDPGDEVPPATPGPSTAPGFPSRAEIIDRYAFLSGRDVSDLPYWIAFNRWRGACIGAGVRARYLHGDMADDGYREQAVKRGDDGVRLAEAARETLRDL